MRLPIELINLICDYTGDGKYLCFDKRMYYSFRINSEYEKYNDVRDLYRNCMINSYYDDIDEEQITQIHYEIKLKKIPSLIMNMHNIESIKNYMVITISEKNNDIHIEHSACATLYINNGTLMLL
jgi:hypothetical protein